ncbi:MAG: DEAD/DEAH box helicase family protein [Akkermansiaceae bacterium]
MKRVAEAFDKRKRKALVIQATGTGKTRVSIALCELMIRAKWAKRILFLCDRRELRKQASDAFDEHLPSEPRVLVTRATSGDRTKRIYLSTYPAMMKCYMDFDPGFFDLVIADESHRSIYNRYRDLFRWFDSYQVGLTATPVKFIQRNTFSLFGCENEDPTANFTYEEAIQHDPPYLCAFKVVKVTTKFLRDGIKYKNLSREQQEQLEEQYSDSESVDYEKEHVSRQVFNLDTDKAILRNLMEKGIRNADGTRLGKTIVFARNHAHAKQLVEAFDEMYPQYGGDFCVRIDNYEPRAEQLIDDFKSTDGSKNLTIAVSVDMLDTGIDVPSLVKLVFAKPVKSYSKFWQMIGRGTRLCYDLFGPGKDKTEFLIFDHWGNFEYFDEQKKEIQPAISKSLPEQLFEARIAMGQTALDKQDLTTLQLSTKLIAADISALPEKCLSVREKWKDIKAIQKDDVLESFEPTTVANLRRIISPLMQWRDCNGHESALRFDLLLAKLITSRLLGSADAESIRDQIIDQVSDLPINLKTVQEKLPFIQKAKQTAFYKSATSEELETLRHEIRGIMRYRKNRGTERPKPLFINVAEDPSEIRSDVHQVKLAGMDFAAYRNRVQSVLDSLFDQSSALQKIRSGQPVVEADLDELISDVLLQDPDLRLEDLLKHYPNKSQSLALAIRRIVGMDAARVNEQFKSFVQQYPTLNANQIRFLELLKSHISTYGAIELDKLWDSPFTSLHSDGVDGVFSDSAQVDALLDLISNLNETAA